MSFPIVSSADARRYLLALRTEDEAPQELSIRYQTLGPEVDWEEIAAKTRSAIEPLQADAGDISRGRGAGRHFEALAAVAVHKAMPTNHPAFSDRNFWTWLAITRFADLIEWRYGNKPKGSDPNNYGIGAAGENFLYRLWLRAEIAYDRRAADPYHMVGLGDVDFWRSHVFRQSYSCARQFARALLRFQFPGGPDDRSRLQVVQIRELAKRLSAARTNLLVEIMDPERATRFIEGEWAKLAETGSGAG
jgi:hypothetical protein